MDFVEICAFKKDGFTNKSAGIEKQKNAKPVLKALRYRNKKIGVTGFEPATSTSRT